jgi:hypothetical protein
MKITFAILVLFSHLYLFAQRETVLDTYDPSIFKKNGIKSWSILYGYDSIISNETILDKVGKKYCIKEWNIKYSDLGDWSKVYYYYNSFGKLERVHTFGSAFDSITTLQNQTHVFYSKFGELISGEFANESMEKNSRFYIKRKQSGDTMIQMGRPYLPFQMWEYFVGKKLVRIECRLFFNRNTNLEPILTYHYRYNMPISENILPCKTDSFGLKFQELIMEEQKKDPSLTSYNIVYRNNYEILDEIEVALNDEHGLPKLIFEISRRDLTWVRSSKIIYKK